VDALDRHDEIVQRRVARDVAGETGFGTSENLSFDLVNAKADDMRVRKVMADPADDSEALPGRHVDDDDIRVGVPRQLERLLDVGRGADHRELRPVRQAGIDSFPVEPNVRDDQQPERFV
jgi:hypothetical protein